VSGGGVADEVVLARITELQARLEQVECERDQYRKLYEFLREENERLKRGLIGRRLAGGVDVVGPAPAPLARIKQRWRWHLVLRSPDRVALGRVTRYALRRAPHPVGVRVTFDRDPVSLL